MDLQQVQQAMEKHLRPQSFPVAVRLIAPDEESAFAAKQPRKDLGIKVPVCQAVTMARRYGWSLAMSQQDMLCAQLSRLAQSAVHASGEPVASDNYGGFACGAEITVPVSSQQCRLVIAGGGDRALAQVQDHEGAFAIPANRLEMIVDGLEKTHKAGLRYPSTPFLAYQGRFPPQFAELMEFLESGEDK
ncbi:MAG: DUF169 domain-containing protein [Desulfosalsimonadaceae bacterium]